MKGSNFNFHTGKNPEWSWNCRFPPDLGTGFDGYIQPLEVKFTSKTLGSGSRKVSTSSQTTLSRMSLMTWAEMI